MLRQSRPLTAFYAFTVLWALNPTSGLWILYLLHCHWSLFQVGLAEAGFHVVSLLAEIPTGVFADRWRRRQSLAVGLGIQAVTLAATWQLAPRSVAGGMLSVSLGALAWAFIGGADRALLYSLIDDGSHYGRVYGTVLAVNLAVRAASTAVGGWMVLSAGWSLPYEIAMVSALMGLLVIPRLPERPRRTMETDVGGAPFKWLDAIRALRATPGLTLLIAFGAGLATLITINNLYAQSTLVLKGASLARAAALVAGSGLMTAVGSWMGGRWAPRRADRAMAAGTTLLGLGIAAVGTLPLTGSSIGYLGAAGVDGLLDPLYETALNAQAPERWRATVLSLPSAGFSLGMVVLFPLAGWAMGAHHLGWTYGLLGMGLMMLAGIYQVARVRGERRGRYHWGARNRRAIARVGLRRTQKLF